MASRIHSEFLMLSVQKLNIRCVLLLHAIIVCIRHIIGNAIGGAKQMLMLCLSALNYYKQND